MYKFIQKYKWTIIMMLSLAITWLINKNIGINAANNTISNFKSMLQVLPPILMMIGLLDVWVPKETMIKYMGKDSGIKGIFIALLLGSLSAGPLYAAFPIAIILIKKEARLAYVLFFLGAWSSSKLTIMVYEFTSFGSKFSIIHIVSNLTIFLIGSFLIEKVLSKSNIKNLTNTI